MPAAGFWVRWFERARELPLRGSFPVGVALLLLAGVWDWMTGPEIASAVFYLPAIIWMTWKGGRWLGLGVALASGATWLGALLMAHPTYPSTLVPYWNALVRTIMFCLVSGLSAEVLERKRVERRLQQTNEALQKQAGILESILNSMGDGVLVADAQGRLLHVNPMARRALRLPDQEMNIAGWLRSQSASPPEPAAGEASGGNPMSRALRGENVDEAEMFVPRGNDEEGVWLSVTGRPLRDSAGQTSGGVVVFGDISARKKLERQITEASDREQRRLGEDLHDGLCQHLVSTAFAARGLAAKLSDRSLPEAEDAVEIAELLGASISQAHDVARGLCLVPLEAGGLASALEELAAHVRSRHRIACRFSETAPVPALEETLGTNLFRIAQEAVNNAIKHAQASQISLTLSVDPEQVRLEIEDDGIGLRAAGKPARGMGLHIMNYRARMVGAALALAPRTGGGTRVTCVARRSTLKEPPANSHDQRG